MAGLVRPRHDADSVRAGSGWPAGGGRGGPVFRVFRVSRTRFVELGVRTRAGRSGGDHHPVRSLRHRRAVYQDPGRYLVRLDRRGLRRRAGAAVGDGRILQGADLADGQFMGHNY